MAGRRLAKAHPAPKAGQQARSNSPHVSKTDDLQWWRIDRWWLTGQWWQIDRWWQTDRRIRTVLP